MCYDRATEVFPAARILETDVSICLQHLSKGFCFKGWIHHSRPDLQVVALQPGNGQEWWVPEEVQVGHRLDLHWGRRLWKMDPRQAFRRAQLTTQEGRRPSWKRHLMLSSSSKNGDTFITVQRSENGFFLNHPGRITLPEEKKIRLQFGVHPIVWSTRVWSKSATRQTVSGNRELTLEMMTSMRYLSDHFIPPLLPEC